MGEERLTFLLSCLSFLLLSPLLLSEFSDLGYINFEKDNLQVKRWENVVGRLEIHKFVGALKGQGANKGIFITTSAFTKEAADYARAQLWRRLLIKSPKVT